ncbi:MAG TPA: DUF655 domain-containing protein [archaeon]|nr:DUF655 domain-containing protein [archaeon]
MGVGMEEAVESKQAGVPSAQEKRRDEWGIVLDFLQHGHYGMARSEPVAYVLGDKYFSLLEVIVREGAALKAGERVYVGDGKRDQIKYIRGRVEPSKLTSAGREELPHVVEGIIKKEPEHFLAFFNKAGPVSMRMHSLELLPGIGKKHLFAVLDARKEGPFTSFAQMRERVPLLPEPEKLVQRRVLEELEGKDKYRIFVPRAEPERGPRRQ